MNHSLSHITAKAAHTAHCQIFRQHLRENSAAPAALPDGDAVVGKKARRLAAVHPDTSFYSVKRLIGRPFADPLVQEEQQRLAYKVGIIGHNLYEQCCLGFFI